jgi:hypothetical protein
MLAYIGLFFATCSCKKLKKQPPAALANESMKLPPNANGLINPLHTAATAILSQRQ